MPDMAGYGILLANLFMSPLRTVVRQRDIAGGADDVDDSRESMVKRLMALDNSRPGNPLEVAAGLSFAVGYPSFNVEKCGWLLRMQQIGDQKPCPGVARTRV